ncbi:MAG: hypothetical protein IPP48_04415 [Chitinophagaceae bacterium]|nr:hypothetical protein [Chitinophagaceae bacterium]
MMLSAKKWLKIALFNLLIVVGIGVILRYKIAFSLPFIDQKHLLHGHSHFAFVGWITQALMIFLVDYLAQQKNDTNIFKKYDWLLKANLFTAYAMLIAFPIEGYGVFSIIASTLSIFVAYSFAVVFWKDLNALNKKNIAHLWFKAALAFNAFSSLGAFALAFMMIKKVVHQNWYLASEYFYLHFQYNGWFFFVCMGLLMVKLSATNSQKKLHTIFILFFLAAVPAYFLSALWMNIPIWVYVLVILAAIIQLWGWVLTVGVLKNSLMFLKESLNSIGRWVLTLSAVALTIKLTLQLGSTIPSLSTLAFGFRPIVIGYLHLVLLGVITLFILGYMFANNFIAANKNTAISVTIFCIGVFVNEFFLMAQGVAALYYTNLPYINEALLVTALVMFCSMLFLFLNYKDKAITK